MIDGILHRRPFTDSAVTAAEEPPRWLTDQLSRRDMGFSGAYILAGQVRDVVADRPTSVTGELVIALSSLMASARHESQTQSFHYYALLAEALAGVIHAPVSGALATRALAGLTRLSVGEAGSRQRAASQALGGLPLGLKKNVLPQGRPGPVSDVAWERLAREAGGDPVLVGRSLVCELGSGTGYLVVKTVPRGQSLAGLVAEARWMEWLAEHSARFSAPFAIPVPLRMGEGFALRLVRPPSVLKRTSLFSGGPPHGIAFTAPSGYFDYPNDHRPGRRLSDRRFARVLFRSARLLGELTGAGVVHTAPIPLFHNRIQRARRDDAGLYQWWRGGRLDRWLHSSRYPNFGCSGLRDFEHLAPVSSKGKTLYRAIGSQLLSLILVAGSHFRHRAPDQMGIDAHGRPADLRPLFDPEMFSRLIFGAVGAFYRGFAGATAPVPMIPDTTILAGQLVEAMGVDRHMTEILRVSDQNRMDDHDFDAFLSAHGRSPDQIRATPRGAADIHLRTGPHLGGFNDRISVPQLIDFLAAASACCVAGRFQAENGWPSA